MFKTSYLFILTLSLILSNSSTSFAEENHRNSIRWYKSYYSGIIHFANMYVDLQQDSLRAEIDTYGIVKKISKYQSDSKSKFLVKDGNYTPQHFETWFQQRKRKRSIDITYDNKGLVKTDKVTPPDHPDKRPPVPKQLKIGAYDPITGVLEARTRIIKAIKNGDKELDLLIYDGRRLAQMFIKLHGKSTQRIKGKKGEYYKITFQRRPVYGYTNNELRRQKEEEPLTTMYLDTTDYYPVKARAKAPLGSVTVLLEKECDTWEECR